MILRGKVWKFERDLSATDLVSSKYDKLAYEDAKACAKYVLEDINPDFASSVQKGDIIVSSEELGTGHAHYYNAAIQGCREAGVSALLAENANTLFLRSAIDEGYLVWSIKGLSSLVNQGDILELDLQKGVAANLTTGKIENLQPIPEAILDIIDAGSSLNWALRRVNG